MKVFKKTIYAALSCALLLYVPVSAHAKSSGVYRSFKNCIEKKGKSRANECFVKIESKDDLRELSRIAGWVKRHVNTDTDMWRDYEVPRYNRHWVLALLPDEDEDFVKKVEKFSIVVHAYTKPSVIGSTSYRLYIVSGATPGTLFSVVETVNKKNGMALYMPYPILARIGVQMVFGKSITTLKDMNKNDIELPKNDSGEPFISASTHHAALDYVFDVNSNFKLTENFETYVPKGFYTIITPYKEDEEIRILLSKYSNKSPEEQEKIINETLLKKFPVSISIDPPADNLDIGFMLYKNVIEQTKRFEYFIDLPGLGDHIPKISEKDLIMYLK